MRWEHVKSTEGSAAPLEPTGSWLAKMLEHKIIFRYERKFWRTAEKRKDLQERRAADFSWHFGRKFWHQIMQDLHLMFWPLPPAAQTNKRSKWLSATETEQRAQLFTEIYTSLDLRHTAALPVLVQHRHSAPTSTERTTAERLTTF